MAAVSVGRAGGGLMFNPDFYPTPPEVAAEMLNPLDLRGRTVLRGLADG